jgi:NADH-quinone oxidoreductase subunit L
VIALAGIGVAWRIYGHGGKAEAIQARFRALHTFFVNKWYFDEAIDFLIVRPAAWLGRFCNSTIERVFVNGALVGGSSGAVRVLSAAVRGLQSGYLRYYAALLLIGFTGLAAYFLVSA